jgi:hydroperoxide dehydratase
VSGLCYCPEAPPPASQGSGCYGPLVVGTLHDSAKFFYGLGGRDGFFASCVCAHGSTVVYLNMPSGPFVAKDPHVVALLDTASLPVLLEHLQQR